MQNHPCCLQLEGHSDDRHSEAGNIFVSKPSSLRYLLKASISTFWLGPCSLFVILQPDLNIWQLFANHAWFPCNYSSQLWIFGACFAQHTCSDLFAANVVFAKDNFLMQNHPRFLCCSCQETCCQGLSQKVCHRGCLCAPDLHLVLFEVYVLVAAAARRCDKVQIWR